MIYQADLLPARFTACITTPMHAPDFFTVLLSYLIAASLSTIMLAMLWRHAGGREPAVAYWLAGSALHLAAIIAFGLRGQMPEAVPIFVGGFLVILSGIATRNGVAVFLDRPVRSYVWLMVLFLTIHAGFTYLSPDIRARNMNLALATALLYGDTARLFGRWTPATLRPASTLTQIMATLLALCSIGNLVFFGLVDEKWIGLRSQGPASAIVMLAYQFFVLGLSVSCVLLVNRRLYDEVERERDEHRRIAHELGLSEARLERAELTAKVGNWEMDLKAGTFNASVGTEAIYGGKKSDFDYAAMRAMPLPEYRPVIEAGLTRAMNEGIPYETHFKIRTIDTGELKDLHSRGAYDAQRGVMYGVIQDVTEQNAAAENLQLAASVFSHANEGILIMDPGGVVLEINAALERITGYERHEIVGHNIAEQNPPELPEAVYQAVWAELREKDIWDGELVRRRKSGALYVIQVTISAVRNTAGAVTHYVTLFNDISELKDQQRRLQELAHYDALTGLPNRVLLADRLQQGIVQSQRRNLPLALAFLDLDGFKAVNDQHGHNTGDTLLIELAKRMKHALREGDTLARVGGDEFIAVLGDLRDEHECRQVLERLLEAAATPLSIGTLTLQVSASVGVTLYPQDYVDADMLLRHADQAMYVAKQSGKNQYRFYADAA